MQFIDFDGENFGFGTQLLQIHASGGIGPIHQLSAFPLAYHYEVEKVREGLIARGKVFKAYKGYHFKAYEGIAMGWGPWGLVQYSVNSRIIIDTYAFNGFGPNRKVSLAYLRLGEADEDDDCDSNISLIDGDITQ